MGGGRGELLQDAAKAAGFTQESLAKLVGVDKTTISRLWVDPEWLDRIKSPTLKRLIAVIPGLDSVLTLSSLADRREHLKQGLLPAGIRIDDDALDAAIDEAGVPPQFLLTALEAAAHLLNENKDAAISALRACWGRPQTRALDIVFGTHQVAGPIIGDVATLVDAAESMFEVLLRAKGTSHRRTIAQAHLAHHVGKAKGRLIHEEVKDPTARRRLKDQRTSLFLRGAYMGVLRKTDDLDLASHYNEIVAVDPLARLAELWAFPSWTGDSTAQEEIDAPHVPLTRTASEVVYEIGEYNDAYVWYLVNTYVPLAVQHDATFGGKLFELSVSLQERAERTAMPELADSAQQLARKIRSTTN
jgi:transcriptional regulator with XRE-family HTH domain